MVECCDEVAGLFNDVLEASRNGLRVVGTEDGLFVEGTDIRVCLPYGSYDGIGVFKTPTYTLRRDNCEVLIGKKSVKVKACGKTVFSLDALRKIVGLGKERFFYDEITPVQVKRLARERHCITGLPVWKFFENVLNGRDAEKEMNSLEEFISPLWSSFSKKDVNSMTSLGVFTGENGREALKIASRLSDAEGVPVFVFKSGDRAIVTAFKSLFIAVNEKKTRVELAVREGDRQTFLDLVRMVVLIGLPESVVRGVLLAEKLLRESVERAGYEVGFLKFVREDTLTVELLLKPEENDRACRLEGTARLDADGQATLSLSKELKRKKTLVSMKLYPGIVQPYITFLEKRVPLLDGEVKSFENFLLLFGSLANTDVRPLVKSLRRIATNLAGKEVATAPTRF